MLQEIWIVWTYRKGIRIKWDITLSFKLIKPCERYILCCFVVIDESTLSGCPEFLLVGRMQAFQFPFAYLSGVGRLILVKLEGCDVWTTREAHVYVYEYHQPLTVWVNLPEYISNSWHSINLCSSFFNHFSPIKAIKPLERIKKTEYKNGHGI